MAGVTAFILAALVSAAPHCDDGVRLEFQRLIELPPDVRAVLMSDGDIVDGPMVSGIRPVRARFGSSLAV